MQQHRRDIGIRLALGGDPFHVGRSVVLQGLTVVAVGILLGIGSTFLTTKLVSSVLFGVSATDPVTMIAVPALLMSTAFLACVMPARRAARVDPVEVLKET